MGQASATQPSGGNCQQSLYWNLPSTRKACLPQPCLTACPTHGPASQSTALWFARRDEEACNYKFTEQKGARLLIPHLLLGTEMRHSYASQPTRHPHLGTVKLLRLEGNPQKTITCDRNNQPLISHTTKGPVRKQIKEMEC